MSSFMVLASESGSCDWYSRPGRYFLFSVGLCFVLKKTIGQLSLDLRCMCMCMGMCACVCVYVYVFLTWLTSLS